MAPPFLYFIRILAGPTSSRQQGRKSTVAEFLLQQTVITGDLLRKPGSIGGRFVSGATKYAYPRLGPKMLLRSNIKVLSKSLDNIQKSVLFVVYPGCWISAGTK
jgi:hypothetical protein